VSQPTKTITLGDFTFIIGHITPRKAIRATRMVAAVLGPSIGEIMKLVKGKGGADIGAALESGALASLLRTVGEIDDETMDKLMMMMAEATQVSKEGKVLNGSLAVAFDVVFAGGQLGPMFAWFAAAVEHNFGDFLKSAGGSQQ
jgi:SpoVK/Ycf46/Vps4 family AAA+-type ATPase